ncbi:hypothetical protein EZV62_001415 [Acer yangbiense]|uniref:Transposase Tnp1/En/Spm-like domain-containing protein n=1 Tax=Acer yangbiense TaxID=1000413 RepID=A0A5C7IWF3_9ROSI|nr:hypothetical protein EZV62_001415 [Acer yangbiense]
MSTTEEATSAPSSSVNEKGSKKRRGRGRNKVDLNKIAKAKEDGIRFNTLGQPIGKTSIPLSTTYGVVATQLVPITYESWSQVPDILKDSLWETTKTRFGLDEIDNVVDEEWNKFVKFRLSPEFDDISQRYTELAKKNETPQTTGRKGLARLREKLREAKLARNEDPDEVDRVETWISAHKHKDGTPVNDNVGEMIEKMEGITTDGPKTISDDAVAQVVGKEHRGRVRGLGFGANVGGANVGGATVEGRTHTSSLHHQLQYSSASNREGNSKGVKIIESSSKAAASTSQIGESQRESNKCKLLHWIGSGEVVAEAEIDCTDPTASVHHMILGPYSWRVCVKKILVARYL